MIRPDPLAAVDLNLLVTFRATYDERSVRGAARRLGLSPSAASHALGRLRDLVGDDLFVRTGAQMVPTPRAEALIGPVRRALAQVTEALADDAPFDPARAEGTIRIAAVDLAQVLLLPEVLARLSGAAPGVAIRVLHLPEEPARALLGGAVDLVVGGALLAEGVAREVLWTEAFVCLVRAGHPCLAAPFTVEAWAAQPHVLVQPRGVARGHVDRALAERGLERRIAVVTPGLDLAARVVARSDLVLTTTARGARLPATRYGLRALAPPLPIEPYALSVAWRERRSADPLLRWVRAGLAAVAAELQEIEQAG